MSAHKPFATLPKESLSIPFLSPERELHAHLHSQRESHTAIDLFGLDKFLSNRFHGTPFKQSYLHHPKRSFNEWKKETLEQLRSDLIVPDALGKASDAVVISRETFLDYSVEEIELTVTPPLRAPATVVIPKNGRLKHPAIIALHSMGGQRAYGREKLLEFDGEPSYLSEYRDTYYSGRSLQIELARAGFLSIAIDAFNFGLRTDKAMRNPALFDQWRLHATSDQTRQFTTEASLLEEPKAVRLFESIGLSLASVVATDDARTIDYLVSRDDVDSDRIGCTGLSFGSFRSNYLSAIDDRIKATASACWISTMAGIIDYNVLGAMGFFALPPKLYSRLDMADILALSAPKPFLAISGWKDLLMQPSGIAEAHLFLRRVWKEAGAFGNLGSLVYDAPHTFDATMQKAALSFFKKHLGVSPSVDKEAIGAQCEVAGAGSL